MVRRVVVTGLGTVNPLATEVMSFWQALCAGRSGVGYLERFDASAFKVKLAGEVKGFNPDAFLEGGVGHRLYRFTQFALVASGAAVRDSGLDWAREDPNRCGVILGCGIGGYHEFEDQEKRFRGEGPGAIHPYLLPRMITNAAPASLAIYHGLRGPSSAVNTACASASHAIGDALRAIRWGYADVMLAGGTEAPITPMGLGGFLAARALSSQTESPQTASRPFDRDRDGFVLSEGAGVVVLEELEHARSRGAPIYAELLGCGSTADAYHLTAPHPEGHGASRAMQLALQDARLNPEDVQYVNAHGTSTPLGDEAETKAIKKAFGNHAHRLAISSTKSMLGHTLGASGGIELIATVLSIRHDIVHPTINYETPDRACDLDYVPNTARELRVRRAISNSFGFGGHNCCLAVGAV
jgi:3-oxoacyl-[acyl-carrier-protein] synthase II